MMLDTLTDSFENVCGVKCCLKTINIDLFTKSAIKKKFDIKPVRIYDKDIKDDNKMKKKILTALVGTLKNICGDKHYLKSIGVEYTHFPARPKDLKEFSNKFDNIKSEEPKSVKEFNETFPDGLDTKGEEVHAIYIEERKYN